MITIDHVSKSFRTNDGTTKEVLHDLSLTIPDDQFICLLGPSGCGKSTLLRLISGLDTTTSGTIRINGKPVSGPPVKSAFVFQSYALFPWLTVLENVVLGMKFNGLYDDAKRQEQAKRYLQVVHLEGYEHHYIRQLSGGMKQRVAIARALATEPDLLFMDEPFGALDTFTRMELQRLVKNLCARRHLTILFVTHDIDEAIYLADRVAVLDGKTKRIDHLIPIQMPIERDRTSTHFNEYRKEIYAAFHMERPDEIAHDKGAYVI